MTPEDMRRLAVISGLALLAMAALFYVATRPARAHDWYPSACCSDTDCRPVPDSWVNLENGGWRLGPTGEVIPFTRARPSPDGQFHWCTYQGRDDAGTICLFVPGSSS